MPPLLLRETPHRFEIAGGNSVETISVIANDPDNVLKE